VRKHRLIANLPRIIAIATWLLQSLLLSDLSAVEAWQVDSLVPNNSRIRLKA
jgi:hypothetical protein